MACSRVVLALCLPVGALACGGDSDQTAVTPVATELSVMTFNAALGVGLAPYLEQRLSVLERDLPATAADVLCLQELWRPEDIDRLTSSLGAEFPYSHKSVQATSPAPEQAGPACSAAEADLLQTCLIDNCADVERAVLPLCALSNCAMAFSEVSMPCQQCIAANQSAADVDELTALCGGDAPTLAYRDQTGLLLLSRYPLDEPDYLALTSALGDRGVLSARVNTSFAGSVDVFCTHLAASIGQDLYQGEFGSWEGERLVQIDELLELVDARNAPEAPTIVLGDLNCGPATAEALPASADAFERFVSAGYAAPYVSSDGRCTFCGDNPLNDFDDDAGNDLSELGVILDHVLLSNIDAAASAARVFDDVVQIQAETALDVTRSDHYGVQVTLAPE